MHPKRRNLPHSREFVIGFPQVAVEFTTRGPETTYTYRDAIFGKELACFMHQ